MSERGYFIMIPFATRERAEEEVVKLPLIGRVVEHTWEDDSLWNSYVQSESVWELMERKSK